MSVYQIVLFGLIEIVSGDLFDMLLPMLTIYQEYVRNHHYCLQVSKTGKTAKPLAMYGIGRVSGFINTIHNWGKMFE